jgi:WxcM-like, C-terminal
VTKIQETSLAVPGANLLTFGSHFDLNGGNAFVNFADLPFMPYRLYTVHDVGEGRSRGDHAHRLYSQILIASAGSCRISLYDGNVQDEVFLSRPFEALFVPPRVWTRATDFAPGSALTVLSSGPFDRSELITDVQDLVDQPDRRYT